MRGWPGGRRRSCTSRRCRSRRRRPGRGGCAAAAVAIGDSGSLRLLDRASLARDLLAGGAGRPAVPGLASRAARETDGYDIGVMRQEMATIPGVIASHLADPGGHVTRLAQWLGERRIRHAFLTGCRDSAFAATASSLAFPP